MELDVDNRRLALSHKHLEENPWETFESVFERGSIHKCTIVNLSDKGAVLELPYGIEGHCSGKNLQKEDGEKASEGETLDFRVMDFSKEEKRIQLSHTASWKAGEQEVAPKKKTAKKGNTLDKINKEVEKSTLGDLDALSALKQKMETPAPKEEAKKEVVKEEKKEEKKAPKKAAAKKEEKVEEVKEEKPKAKKAAPKAAAKKEAAPKAEKKPAKKAAKKEDKEKK